ncbi:hypothetical protein [Streptomyces sp. NPDC005438]|uniref:hypothetical protein n=1 Tax=Streptomyces sp. NPDC005438 TaxID=3156880 RepID=UPI0033AF0F9C
MNTHNGRGQGDDPYPAHSAPREGVVLPSHGEPWYPGQDSEPEPSRAQPSQGQPWGQPWGPQSPQDHTPPAGHQQSAGQLPPEAGGYGSYGQRTEPGPPTGQYSNGAPPSIPPTAPPPPAHAPGLPGQPPAQPSHTGSAPLPPAAGPVGELPQGSAPQQGHSTSGYGYPGYASPPGGQYAGGNPDAEATAMMPPIDPGAPPPGGGQPAMGSPDSEQTQFLPPQSGDPESTTQLRAVRPGGAHSTGGAGAASMGQGPGQQPADSGTRQPLSDFDNLFRSEAPPAGGDHTQQLPLFDQAANSQGGPGAGGPSQPSYGYDDYEPDDRGRRSPALLLGVGVAVLAALGLAVGAAISFSGDGEGTPDASASPSAQKESKAPDPVKPQAKKLDALLGDSNNSRSTVINSVNAIRQCKNLHQAAVDLRAAAKQRNSLITRLNALEKDKIPNNAKLTAHLKSAWRHSAAADNHYAAWAGEMADKKHGCKKGKSRATQHALVGNRASGSATIEKKRAAALWNPTAKKYGHKERQYTEL